MKRRMGVRWALWICGLSIGLLWRPVAGETIATGVQPAESQLRELKAAGDALHSAERGQVDPPASGNGTVLEAHKRLIDFEVKQQKELLARETELREVRGQIASLKADVEKLKAAARQQDGESAERAKERESREAKSRGELAAMRAQLEKLQASLAGERNEREKAQNEVKRLVAERDKLKAQLEQPHDAPEPAAPNEEALSQQEGTETDVPGIKKWRKPDGSLFFGERPPPGSKLLGGVENLGTSGGGTDPAGASP